MKFPMFQFVPTASGKSQDLYSALPASLRSLYINKVPLRSLSSPG